MEKEPQQKISLRFENRKVLRIVRKIRDLHDSLSGLRKQPNVHNLKKQVQGIIEEQIRDLSGLAPDLEIGIRYILLERTVGSDLARHQTDLKSHYITQEQYERYDREYNTMLEARAKAVPAYILKRIRLMLLTKAQLQALRSKRYKAKHPERYSEINHVDNKTRLKEKKEWIRKKRKDPEYRKKELARDERQRKKRINEKQEDKRGEDQWLQHSQPVQVFPAPEKK